MRRKATNKELREQRRKRCLACQRIKSLDDFYSFRQAGRTYHSSRCKRCTVEAKVAYHRTEHGKEVHENAMSNYRYGIPRVKYETQVAEGCGICHKFQDQLPEGVFMVLDHDHNTGKVREPLCSVHNLLVGQVENGLIKNWTPIATKALEYVEKHKN